MYAPQRGVVIPTLMYRTFFKNWAAPIVSPIASSLSTSWATLWGLGRTGWSSTSYEAAMNGKPAMTAYTQASWKKQETVEEESWDWSMAGDEVLRR